MLIMKAKYEELVEIIAEQNKKIAELFQIIHEMSDAKTKTTKEKKSTPGNQNVWESANRFATLSVDETLPSSGQKKMDADFPALAKKRTIEASDNPMPKKRNASPKPSTSWSNQQESDSSGSDDDTNIHGANKDRKRTRTDFDSSKKPNSRQTKPPPIIVSNTSSKTTIEITKSASIQNFYTKKINRIKHSLYVENLEDYKKACATLKAKNIEYFTYTPKIEERKTVLLKNIEGNFEPSDILSALKDKYVDQVSFVSVNRFRTRRSIYENRNLPIFVVQLTPDSKIGNLNNTM
ncbi:hypothetical protein KM043_018539 [Ampulex compressa]|nr:hypothetical protein KM043_018539 [Ampulex compressa]